MATATEREWRVHTGPLPCSECGETTAEYYVRWVLNPDGKWSDGDEHICPDCQQVTDLYDGLDDLVPEPEEKPEDYDEDAEEEEW